MKDYYPLPFIDQMLDTLAGHPHFCFLDGYSGYNQIAMALEDQEKTTFTCPYGTFAFRRMPFGLCNAAATFQRCMMSIFSYWVEEAMKIFMDDFSVYVSVRLFLYRLKPLKLTQLQEPYNSLIPMSLWMIWLLK